MKNSIFQSILKLSILCSIILFLLSSAYATGVLDPTFGTNGKVIMNIGQVAYVNTIAIQPDGKIIVFGNLVRLGANDIVMFRFNPNGSLDSSFGDGGRVTMANSNPYYLANALAIQTDGKIVIAISIRRQEIPSGDFLVARYNPNGTPDVSFGANGIVTLNQGPFDSANAVAIQPDGKIVVAGETTNDAGSIAVFRLNGENGSVDTSFADGGLGFYRYNVRGGGTTYAMPQNVVILPNGRILVGVMATRHDGFVSFTFATVLLMLENNGTLAQNFGSGGIASYDYPNKGGISGFDLAVLPDGKILVASNDDMLFSSNGTPEWYSGFGGDRNSDVALRTDGRYITMGLSGMRLFTPDHRLISRAIGGGYDIAVQPDNKVVIIDRTDTGFSVTRLTTITSQGTLTVDYDGGFKRTSVAVFRPANSTLYVLHDFYGFVSYPSAEASFEIKRVMPPELSNPYAYPFEYWKGGNVTGAPATFCSTNGYGANHRLCLRWGQIGDIPVSGVYDGYGFTNKAVYRPSEGVWYINQGSDGSNDQFRAVRWGSSEDKPVPADYDYDGITDIAVYRPSTGTWWILRSSDGGYFAVRFGIASDIPLTGDFDGDGFADFTVYRASEGNWYQLLTTEGFRAVRFGLPTDFPVPGDYDRDGRHDIAVYREGFWYLLQSTEGFKAERLGLPGDIPVSVRYDQ